MRALLDSHIKEVVGREVKWKHDTENALLEGALDNVSIIFRDQNRS